MNKVSESLPLEVVITDTFDAAHFLPNYPGKCARVHGHMWTVEIGITGVSNPTTGMVIDFGDLKRILKVAVIDKLDHTLLNLKDVEGRLEFPSDMPTAENILTWIVKSLKPLLPQLTYVRLAESPSSWVVWRKQ